MNKYYLLALFNGVVHKVYDDLYDNDLYEYFNIKLEQKEYINELLKCLFGISFTILSLKYPFFLFIFIILNVILYFLDNSAYGAYELSGLISTFILIPFVDFNNTFKNITSIEIIFFVLASLISFVIEKYFYFKQEYNNNKLVIRFFISVLSISLLVFNYFSNFLTENIMLCLLFSLGYMITSCIFQIILLNKNNDENKDKNNYRNKIIV